MNILELLNELQNIWWWSVPLGAFVFFYACCFLSLVKGLIVWYVNEKGYPHAKGFMAWIVRKVEGIEVTHTDWIRIKYNHSAFCYCFKNQENERDYVTLESIHITFIIYLIICFSLFLLIHFIPSIYLYIIGSTYSTLWVARQVVRTKKKVFSAMENLDEHIEDKDAHNVS